MDLKWLTVPDTKTYYEVSHIYQSDTDTWINRPIKQNIKSRIFSSINANVIFNKDNKDTLSLRDDILITKLENIELDPFLISYTKINCKWIRNLNAKRKKNI